MVLYYYYHIFVIQRALFHIASRGVWERNTERLVALLAYAEIVSRQIIIRLCILLNSSCSKSW